MKLAKDMDFRMDIAKRSREWVIKTHSPDLVAAKHLEVFRNTVL
jgi:hypothetical protein